MNNPKIVILGGGYAGLIAAYRLAGKLGADAHITLVDGKPHFLERIRLHQWATSQPVPRRSYTRLLAGNRVRFVQGWASAIDPDSNRLSVGTAGGAVALDYDYLVYAAGSATDKQTVPGVAAHAYTVGHEADGTRLREALASPGNGIRDVVVVGGGLTGIESAAEVAERFPSLSVRLLTAGLLGAGLSPQGRAHVLSVMDRLGVTVEQNVTVRAVDATHLLMGDGRVLSTDLTIWSAAFRVSPLAGASGITVNARDQVRVDHHLRSLSHPHIYAVGDAADLSRAVATPIRMACATAMPMGAYAATHLVARVKGQNPPAPFRFAYMIQCISLGRRDGLVQAVDPIDRPAPRILTGRAAALVKELICRYTVFALHQERWWPGSFTFPRGPKPSASLAPLLE